MQFRRKFGDFRCRFYQILWRFNLVNRRYRQRNRKIRNKNKKSRYDFKLQRQNRPIEQNKSFKSGMKHAWIDRRRTILKSDANGRNRIRRNVKLYKIIMNPGKRNCAKQLGKKIWRASIRENFKIRSFYALKRTSLLDRTRKKWLGQNCIRSLRELAKTMNGARSEQRQKRSRVWVSLIFEQKI